MATSRWRGAASLTTRSFVWSLVVVAIAVISVSVLVPRLVGATPYTILTGSMTPALPPGTLVVVRPRPADEIGVGDVVTVQLESARATVVTHRVVAVEQGLDGERRFRTQGDVNDVPDAEPRRAVQVRGVVWYAVPHVGRLNTALTGADRQLATYVVAAGLVLYAGLQAGGALRERRRRGWVPAEVPGARANRKRKGVTQ